MDKIIVTITGILGIAFVYWFFLGKKEKEVEAMDSTIDIVVEGGYTPEAISVPVNKTTKINFLRKDPNSCLEEVVIPDFRIKKFLPLNEKVTVSIKPEKAGEFAFVCGMNMYHGKIIAK